MERETKRPDYGMIEKYGPGVIGVAAPGSVGRYKDFEICLHGLERPKGSKLTFEMSCNVSKNMNNMCEKTLQGGYEWLFILGDDHVFKPDTLMRLLCEDKDIIVPYNLQRGAPYAPVINGSEKERYARLDASVVEGKSGVIDLNGRTCGNAGMLIKRKVLAEIGGDWHRPECRKSHLSGPDIWFCKRAIECGFKIWLALNIPMGHLMVNAVWPVIDENNHHSISIRPPMDMP